MVWGMGRVNPKLPRRDVTLGPNFCLHNQSFLSARSVNVRKMSSDLELSDLSERSSNTEEGETEEEEDQDVEIIYSQLTPCQDEPLAEVDASDNTQDTDDVEEGESDEDGLTAATLKARYEREWCQCEQCSDENLVGSRELRCCCREVTNASTRLAFDGSIERLTCIAQHDDNVAMAKRTVLLQVGPLLRDKDGQATQNGKASLIGRLFKMCRT